MKSSRCHQPTRWNKLRPRSRRRSFRTCSLHSLNRNQRDISHSRPKPSEFEMAMVSLCLSSFRFRYGGRQIWLKQVWEIGNLQRHSQEKVSHIFTVFTSHFTQRIKRKNIDPDSRSSPVLNIVTSLSDELPWNLVEVWTLSTESFSLVFVQKFYFPCLFIDCSQLCNDIVVIGARRRHNRCWQQRVVIAGDFYPHDPV